MSPGKSVRREYLEALLIAVVFATFARTWVVQAFKIPTGSMEPNLLVGDHILVNKFIYAPAATRLERWLLPQRPVRRGDVVVFKYPQQPERDFIKRCVGGGGDIVEIVDKKLHIDGEEIDESAYAYFEDARVYRSRFVGERYRLRDNFGPYEVPQARYFCLGDNRDNSRDSRYWGPVPEGYVKGRALLIYWSFAHGGVRGAAADAPAGGGERPRRLVARALGGVRWKRCLELVR